MPVALIETAISGFLVVKGMQVAIKLRDIKPRAVQSAKSLLKLCLAWTFLSIPIVAFSGIANEILLPAIGNAVFKGVVGFLIWFGYFSVSMRVRSTYQDWRD